MDWLDIEELVEMLHEKYPEQDIYSLKFTNLKKMIMELEGFEGEEHKCNEKILEVVQGKWFELKQS
jgi:FeS assembly protein IscX